MNIKSLLIGSAAALAAATMAIASAHAADIAYDSPAACVMSKPADLIAAGPVDTTIIEPVTASTEPKYSDDIGATKLANYPVGWTKSYPNGWGDQAAFPFGWNEDGTQLVPGGGGGGDHLAEAGGAKRPIFKGDLGGTTVV